MAFCIESREERKERESRLNAPEKHGSRRGNTGHPPSTPKPEKSIPRK